MKDQVANSLITAAKRASDHAIATQARQSTDKDLPQPNLPGTARNAPLPGNDRIRQRHDVPPVLSQVYPAEAEALQVPIGRVAARTTSNPHGRDGGGAVRNARMVDNSLRAAVSPQAVRPAAQLALMIACVALATIAGAWAFEWAGYPPCELCLKERLPYYGGIPVALLVAWLAQRGRNSLLAAGFAALLLMFGAGAIVAIYHAGVEWKFWPGPTSCTGSFDHAKDVGDFLQQLKTVTVVRCDAAALRILGVSLAGWDALICTALAALAAEGFVHRSTTSG